MLNFGLISDHIQRKKMKVKKYLISKYGMDQSAGVPSSYLADELLIEKSEVKGMVRSHLGRSKQIIPFEAFCKIIEDEI